MLGLRGGKAKGGGDGGAGKQGLHLMLLSVGCGKA